MIYLDNAALEKPTKESIECALDILNNKWHNPNSIYENGVNAKRVIENSKQIIAHEINCNPEDLIFCSCGSEANSLATCGYIRKHKQDHFITSNIEHASIAENPYAIKRVSVDSYGFFNLDDIQTIHDSLVSLQLANSEIGTIQNMKNIIRILHNNHCIVHTDAVAAFGKMKINVKDLDVDMLTATGQKVGGIVGAAFLYKKKNIDLEPLIFGHKTLRGGTPNVAAIASLGKAVENFDRSSISPKNRDYVYKYLVDHIPDSYLVGAPLEYRLPHNLYMCFKGVQGESLMILLDMCDIQVSTGSACSSGNMTASPTLAALRMNSDDMYSCIRLSFSGDETQETLDIVCQRIKECVERLRSFS